MRHVNYEETYWRSIIKSFSWRLLGTASTILIAYIITGESNLAQKIGLIECISKFIIYYFHERLWNFMPIGKIRERS